MTRWDPMSPQPYTRDPQFGREPFPVDVPLGAGDRVRLRTMFLEGYEGDGLGGIYDHRGEPVDPRKAYQRIRDFGGDWCSIHLADEVVADGAEYARRYEANRAGGAA